MWNSLPRTSPDLLVNTDHISEKLTKASCTFLSASGVERPPGKIPRFFCKKPPQKAAGIIALRLAGFENLLFLKSVQPRYVKSRIISEWA